MKIQSLLRFLITAVVFIIALLLGHALWRHYLYAPWTRDGRVRAEVVRIAPDVTGLVTQVPVADNQAVHKGDVLLTIDEERYRFAVEQAEANLAAAQASASAAGASIKAAMAATAARKTEFDMRQEQAVRRQQLGDVIAQESRNDATSAAAAAHAGFQQAQAGASQARAARGQALAAVQQAQAALDTARLNLSRAVVRAPVDGYVTNLDVRVGDYAAVGHPLMALIDSHSYYLYGYFEETKLPQLRVGDPVDITLMAGGARFKGHISGIARGISDRDNPTGGDLLASVNPTFNWVRLAQRVPVRIAIDTANLPPDTVLAAGTTATIEVHPHQAGAAR
jgi:multidrug resistance efflux pump